MIVNEMKERLQLAMYAVGMGVAFWVSPTVRQGAREVGIPNSRIFFCMGLPFAVTIDIVGAMIGFLGLLGVKVI